MANLFVRTYTFADGTIAYGSQVESEVSNIVTVLNNLNTAATNWGQLTSLHSTNVPLIADCSSGSQHIADFKNNSVINAYVASTGGIVSNAGNIEAVVNTSSAARGVISTQISADQASAHFSGKKARGTASAPAAVVALDYITTLAANPYDGSTYLLPAIAGFQVTPGATISTGSVPTDYVVATGTGTPGDGTERLRIDNAGHVGITKNGSSDTNGTLSVTALASTNAGRFLNSDASFATVYINNSNASGTGLSIDASPLAITKTTNQIILGTTRTATLTAPTPATTSRVYTFPDQGADYSVVATEGAQTINGNKTVSGTTNLSALTVSTALALDGSKNIVSSATTGTELGYVSGVTSAIQTQINGKLATPTAWTTSFTPVVAAGTGSITTYTATCHYQQIGKIVHIQIAVALTNAGTGASYMTVTLPVAENTSVQQHVLSGKETASTSKMLAGHISAQVAYVHFYDGTTVIGTGRTINLTGIYEAA